MNSLKQRRDCSEYVFSNVSIVELLKDVLDWATEDSAFRAEQIEKLFESMTIEYVNEKKGYYNARLFIAK